MITFGFQPDFWRRMGIRELRAWVAKRDRDIDVRVHGQQTDPNSWAGGRDAWWQEQDRKRREDR